MTRASGEGLLRFVNQTWEATADLRAGGDPDVLRGDLGQKFAALGAPRLGPEGASRLRDAIEHLDDVEDVGELTR